MKSPALEASGEVNAVVSSLDRVDHLEAGPV